MAVGALRPKVAIQKRCQGAKSLLKSLQESPRDDMEWLPQRRRGLIERQSNARAGRIVWQRY